MSKDNRKILRAPRIHGRLVKDEDEIEELLSPSQGQKLIESGALSGDWDFEGDDEEPPTEKPSELKEIRDALEESAKIRDSVSLQNATLFDANTALNKQVKDLQTENANLKRELQEAGDDSQAALKKSQIEIDDLKAQVETLKADLEKAQKPKTPAK